MIIRNKITDDDDNDDDDNDDDGASGNYSIKRSVGMKLLMVVWNDFDDHKK